MGDLNNNWHLGPFFKKKKKRKRWGWRWWEAIHCLWPWIKLVLLTLKIMPMCVWMQSMLLGIRVRTSKDLECQYGTVHCTHLYVINLVSFKSVLKSALAVMYLSLMYSSNSLCFFCKETIIRKLITNLLN